MTSRGSQKCNHGSNDFWRNVLSELCTIRKNLSAQRFVNQYPRAVEAIVDEHFVDDMFTSVKSEAQAES